MELVCWEPKIADMQNNKRKQSSKTETFRFINRHTKEVRLVKMKNLETAWNNATAKCAEFNWNTIDLVIRRSA